MLKEPVWSPEIGWYYFAGGLAGASATLAAAARLRGNDRLARSAVLTAMSGVLVSPPLLIRDLGVPRRFHHMLRVVKPTSPMSVGTWILTPIGAALGVAAASEVTGVARGAGRAAELAAGALGPLLSTYTAVLTANTAVPAWNAARLELPFVFAGSAAASAGAAAAMLTPAADAAPARTLAAVGAAMEVSAVVVMERRLGELAAPYRAGTPHHLGRASKLLTTGGAATLVMFGRRSPVAIGAGIAVLAGAVCERFSVLGAGFASARDPAHTIGPQRARIERGETAGS